MDRNICLSTTTIPCTFGSIYDENMNPNCDGSVTVPSWTIQVNRKSKSKKKVVVPLPINSSYALRDTRRQGGQAPVKIGHISLPDNNGCIQYSCMEYEGI